MRGALEEAERRGEPAVILLGAPAYYVALRLRACVTVRTHATRSPASPRSGFVIEEQDFQIAVIDEARAVTLAGEVRWHPAFG